MKDTDWCQPPHRLNGDVTKARRKLATQFTTLTCEDAKEGAYMQRALTRKDVSYRSSAHPHRLLASSRKMILLTMTCEAKDVPPRFAMTGAVRWIKAKTVMNGAEPCAILVRAG